MAFKMVLLDNYEAICIIKKKKQKISDCNSFISITFFYYPYNILAWYL